MKRKVMPCLSINGSEDWLKSVLKIMTGIPSRMFSPRLSFALIP